MTRSGAFTSFDFNPDFVATALNAPVAVMAPPSVMPLQSWIGFQAKKKKLIEQNSMWVTRTHTNPLTVKTNKLCNRIHHVSNVSNTRHYNESSTKQTAAMASF